ncbi:hypothetical protein ACFOW1_11270 [Parasediminibacterium paludis]|uniref:OsmC-like protein n=1 Tax=Parasediminibacterium paludis TaxID=908966 RepID=A0ABV8PYF5_9BACT
MVVLKFTLQQDNNDITMKRMGKDIASRHTVIYGSNKMNASSIELLAAAIATSACTILQSHCDKNKIDICTIEATIKFNPDVNSIIREMDLSLIITGGIDNYQKKMLENVLNNELIYYYLICSNIKTTITVTKKVKWRTVILNILNNLN